MKAPFDRAVGSPTSHDVRASSLAVCGAVRYEECVASASFTVDDFDCKPAMSRQAEADDMGKGLRRTNGGFMSAAMAGSSALRSLVAGSEPGPLSEVLERMVDRGSGQLPSSARADLLATIQERIIPQLVLAHAGDAAVPAECADVRLPPTEAEVDAFASIVVAEDVPRALAFIERLASEGVSLEVVLLHLIAPAARLLGEQWLADARPFTEVTVALGALQRIVHILGPSFAPGIGDRGTVVLVAAPSEQHTLGVYLLGEFLRRAGWGVQVDPGMPDDELFSLVGSVKVDLVGISMSSLDLLAPVARRVAAIKKASCNPRLAVMVGGSTLVATEVASIGAIFCNDPRDAVRWLEQHVRVGVALGGS